MPKKYKNCFHCGYKLEVRNGENYCTQPIRGSSVSASDIHGCYYTWNTDPRNGGMTSAEIWEQAKEEKSNA